MNLWSISDTETKLKNWNQISLQCLTSLILFLYLSIKDEVPGDLGTILIRHTGMRGHIALALGLAIVASLLELGEGASRVIDQGIKKVF